MLFAAGKNGAPAVDFRRKIQYTVGVIVDRKPGEQSKRAKNNIISGCSAVGSACTLGCEAERRRRRMQRGGVRAAVEKIEQANSARIFSGTASRASKASGQKSQQLCKDSWCKTKYFGV